MGCFNTKGFFSNLDLEGGDEAFVFLCTQYHKPLLFNEKYNDKYYKNNYRRSGRMIPFSLPIFGEYDDYGQIDNIVHDDNVNMLEGVFKDTIENVLDLLNKVTIRADHLTEEEINRYMSYRKKLGLTSYFTREDLEEKYNNSHENLRKALSLDHYIKMQQENAWNEEITWTMDHAWVYYVLGNIFKEGDYPVSDLFRNISENNSSKEDLDRMASFHRYIDENFLDYSTHYSTCQFVDWESISIYTEALNNFVKSKICKN